MKIELGNSKWYWTTHLSSIYPAFFLLFLCLVGWLVGIFLSACLFVYSCLFVCLFMKLPLKILSLWYRSYRIKQYTIHQTNQSQRNNNFHQNWWYTVLCTCCFERSSMWFKQSGVLRIIIPTVNKPNPPSPPRFDNINSRSSNNLPLFRNSHLTLQRSGCSTKLLKNYMKFHPDKLRCVRENEAKLCFLLISWLSLEAMATAWQGSMVPVSSRVLSLECQQSSHP